MCSSITILCYVRIWCFMYIDSKFNMKQITSVLRDDKVLYLWDKPTKELSPNQMTILRKACRSKFLIIHGPPGEYSYVLYIILYVGKFWSGKKLANLANRRPFANFYPPMFLFRISFSYTCGSFANILPSN